MNSDLGKGLALLLSLLMPVHIAVRVTMGHFSQLGSGRPWEGGRGKGEGTKTQAAQCGVET